MRSTPCGARQGPQPQRHGHEPRWWLGRGLCPDRGGAPTLGRYMPGVRGRTPGWPKAVPCVRRHRSARAGTLPRWGRISGGLAARLWGGPASARRRRRYLPGGVLGRPWMGSADRQAGRRSRWRRRPAKSVRAGSSRPAEPDARGVALDRADPRRSRLPTPDRRSTKLSASEHETASDLLGASRRRPRHSGRKPACPPCRGHSADRGGAWGRPKLMARLATSPSAIETFADSIPIGIFGVLRCLVWVVGRHAGNPRSSFPATK